MRSEYIDREVWQAIMPSMMPANALAVAVMLETGMRIGDVLKLRVEDIGKCCIVYTAEKTGKMSIAECKPELIDLLQRAAVRGWCFPPGRAGSKTPHRTRAAVWYDVRKAAKYAGLKPHVSPHSARKTFAVNLYHQKGINAVQAALQHDSVNTTNLYALSDVQGSTYNRERLVNEVSDLVMQRLSDVLRVDLCKK